MGNLRSNEVLVAEGRIGDMLREGRALTVKDMEGVYTDLGMPESSARNILGRMRGGLFEKMTGVKPVIERHRRVIIITEDGSEKAKENAQELMYRIEFREKGDYF